jgi:hypothetical protein
MAALCRHYLKKNVDKSCQNADYSQDSLPPDLVKYRALDALLSRQLAKIIMKLIAAKVPSDSVLNAPSHNELVKGADANVLIGGRCAATAKAVFVGGINGKSRNFGDLLVSNQKATVQRTDIYIRGAKPLFQKSQKAWPKTVTSGWVFVKCENREIAVKTSNLAVQLKDSNSTIPHFENTAEMGVTQIGNDGIDRDNEDVRVLNSTHDDVAGAFADVPDELSMGPDEESEDIPQCRQHKDLWHQFNSLPLAKTCEVCTATLRLLIHATY